MTVEDWRGKPLPEGHPFKGTTIVFGQKRPASPAASRADLLKPPARERFESQYEDAIAVWRERVGRIRAMEARAKAAGADLDDQGETK